jgi:hypothetical protein
MIEGIHYDQSFSPVAIFGSIIVLLNLGVAQGKQVYILHIKNALQNTIEFYPRKRTNNTLPLFFVEYICLCCDNHPNLATVEQDPAAFVVQNFCSVQGQKD